jgi:hypothetical protein
LAGTDGSGGTEGSDGTAGPVAEEPTQAPPQSKRELVAAGSSDARKKAASSTKQLGKGSKGAPGAEPIDADGVAAAGDSIEIAQVKDEQLAAPDADVDRSESGLSSTGAQVLALLVLACLLIANRRRTRLAGTN